MSHPSRLYAAPNFLKMGIKMPRFVVFWTTSIIKDEKTAAKFHYIKTVSGKSCSAFNCLSSGVNILAGGRPLPPEILPPSHLPSPVNGILWEMSVLITQERIVVGSSNLVEGLTTWPAMYDHWPKSKGQRSRSLTRSRNVSAAITLELGNGWSYQLKTWWKLSPPGAHHVTHFLGQ